MGVCSSKLCASPIEKEKLFCVIDGLQEEFVNQYCEVNKEYFEHADIINTAFGVFIKQKNAQEDFRKALRLGWKGRSRRDYYRNHEVIVYTHAHDAGVVIEHIDTVYSGMRLRSFPRQ